MWSISNVVDYLAALVFCMRSGVRLEKSVEDNKKKDIVT